MTDIKFHGIRTNPIAVTAIELWSKRLEQTFARIEHCSVTIEVPHRRHPNGNAFHVRIDLAVAGKTFDVTRDHDDVYRAIAEAFLAIRRQLRDHARIVRHEVKTHAA